MGLSRIGQIKRLTLLNEWAHPVHLSAHIDLRFNSINDFISSLVRDDFSDNGCTSRREFIKGRHI